MYEYKGGTPSSADWEAAIYGIGADYEYKYFIVSDSYYSELSSKFFAAYTDLSEAIDQYQKELNEIASSSVLSGDFHDALVEYASVFDGLSEKLFQVGSSYQVLCKQFIASVEIADEDMYEAGCDPRDYSNDLINYYITMIEDAKGYIGGSWLENKINNILEGLKNWWYSLTQKNKTNITSPDFKYTKEYRQSLLDKLNYDKTDILNIQADEIEIDRDYETKFGELYDSILQIKAVIDNAKAVVEKGLSRDEISSLRADIKAIVIKEYKEIIEEELTKEQIDQYCSKEENRDVFIDYSSELDNARNGLGVEEAIYAGISTGVSQTVLEVFGNDIPSEVSSSDRYTYLQIKRQLAETIANMAGNPADISDVEKAELYNWLHRCLTGDDSGIPEQYKAFLNQIVKYIKDNSEIAGAVIEGIEEAILPIFYDYSANLKIIQSLANGAASNSLLKIAVDDLMREYTEKVSMGWNNVIEYIREKLIGDVAKDFLGVLKDAIEYCVPGIGVYIFASEKALDLSGVNQIGNDSMRLYSLYETNSQLLCAYKANFDKVASGDYTEIDVDNLKNSFEILKRTFKEEFKLAENIAGAEGNHELKRHYKELYKKIDSMTMSDFV